MSIKKDYAPVNGIKLYYEIHGTGKPLIMIHGGGSTIETSFSVIIPILSKTRQVIAVELQNHGHSGHRTTPQTFEQDAGDVAALMNHLGLTKADLLGFSNGGNTVMQVAIRHPQLVNKLVIISAFYQRDGMIPGFFEGMEKGTFADMPQPLKDAFRAIDPDPAKLMNMYEKDSRRMIEFKNWTDDMLKSIKAPSLIVNGDKDIVTLEHIGKMSNLIAGSEVMILPGVHGQYIGEVCVSDPKSKAPAATTVFIEEFLNK